MMVSGFPLWGGSMKWSDLTKREYHILRIENVLIFGEFYSVFDLPPTLRFYERDRLWATWIFPKPYVAGHGR